jgi:hypothetical protein
LPEQGKEISDRHHVLELFGQSEPLSLRPLTPAPPPLPALARIVCAGQSRERSSRNGCYNEQRFLSAAFGASTINSKELNMTALQGWIVIGLLVLIMLGIVGIGVELKDLPYLWRTDAPNADLER